ncbi:MAG: hypothetical protein AAFZ87_00155 [Planctomycetota bacterium]
MGTTPRVGRVTDSGRWRVVPGTERTSVTRFERVGSHSSVASAGTNRLRVTDGVRVADGAPRVFSPGTHVDFKRERVLAAVHYAFAAVVFGCTFCL